MPRKGMRSFFFSSPKRTATTANMAPSSPRITFSEYLIENDVSAAEEIITKWDIDSSPYAKITSLFYDNRGEAMEFIKSVSNLQHAMQVYVSADSSSEKIIRAQSLMQTAMKRLEKEFYQILAANRDYLDPESMSERSSSNTTVSSISDIEDDFASEDDVQIAGNSIQEVERVSSMVMSDLRAIAECMIQSGYGKECVRIYKIVRKSIVDEGLYRLGFARMSSHQLQKLDWESLEHKIKVWLHAVKIASRTLFTGERILCDHVFDTSGNIKESCFSEIAKEAAVNLFAFAESVTKCKKSPEKMFRFLDMYDAIAELWPDIESTFSYETTSAVRIQAVNALIKIGESVRAMIADFETTIQKDSSKSPVPGGGLHPLTRYVMNYVSFLADYNGILVDILADWPLPVKTPPMVALISDDSSSFSSENPFYPSTVRLAWIILVLLCKLDGKAELHKDVPLAYLFLLNNLQYVITKVKNCNLRLILGEDWITKHEEKVRAYVANYERQAWQKVQMALPDDPAGQQLSSDKVKEGFRRFNLEFEEAYRRHSGWLVPDRKLRDDIKISLARKIVPKYREFYAKYRMTLRNERGLEVTVRFLPEDLENYLSDLFHGDDVLGSSTPLHQPGRRSQ
ncbi:exocyst complex component EXO70H1-like [Aristolochia californica]|uniref:exocyst complex component EXO70H1-like n=1 Tax=Aristolochia californica TaxID=171875 RepID=UPI0035E052F6